MVAESQRPKAKAHLVIDPVKNDTKNVVTTPVSQRAKKLVCPDERELALTAFQRGENYGGIAAPGGHQLQPSGARLRVATVRPTRYSRFTAGELHNCVVVSK